jgi:hypothetical protein
MCPTTTTIPVVIVESHQHALEHVHDVLRKKKIFDETWSMVHFDAHPDLACSKSAPAVAFFNPRHYYCSNSDNHDDDDSVKDRDNAGGEESSIDLYELLDLTPSGIAEWILPLVLAAKLNRIEWVKPSFSSQISEGNYRFAVGVDVKCHDPVDGNNIVDSTKDEKTITSYLDLPLSARMKVDFNHPYYLDDLSVVSSVELVLKQNLDLRVSELRSLPTLVPTLVQQEEKLVSCGIGGEKNNTNTSAERNRNLWTLDICLDYFACHNPYISDLESRNPNATRAFLNVMESSRFNINNTVHSIDNNQPIISLEYQTEIIRFYDLLKQLLLENRHENITKRRLAIDDRSCTTSTNAMSFDEISKYFETAEQAERLIRQLMTEINNDDDDDDDSARLSSMIIEAIPNWSMPHDRSSVAVEKINESLRLVEAHIQKHVQDSDSDHQPFLITIARSTLDGFCPPEMVEILQDRVLDILHRQICGENCQFYNTYDKSPHGNGNCCRLQLVRDYGEWEGSVIPHNNA